MPAILVVLQAVLGILTVLNASTIKYRVFGTFEYLAEIHQIVGMLLLMSLVMNVFLISRRSPSDQTTAYVVPPR